MRNVIKIFFILILFGFFIQNSNVIFGQNETCSQQSSLTAYCHDCAYFLPQNNMACGRAPCCNGCTWPQANEIPWDTYKEGWDTSHTCTDGYCVGDVPLCCYEIERTGDPMLCNGIERRYCHPRQCAQVDPDLGVQCNGGVPGNCGCGQGITAWCVNIDHCYASANNAPYKTLAQRIGQQVTATPTPTATPTRTPTPTTTVGASNTPTPTPPINTQCQQKQIAGDYNCDNQINSTDYSDWSDDARGGLTTLNYFEYWRRASYSN